MYTLWHESLIFIQSILIRNDYIYNQTEGEGGGIAVQCCYVIMCLTLFCVNQRAAWLWGWCDLGNINMNKRVRPNVLGRMDQVTLCYRINRSPPSIDKKDNGP